VPSTPPTSPTCSARRTMEIVLDGLRARKLYVASVPHEPERAGREPARQPRTMLGLEPGHPGSAVVAVFERDGRGWRSRWRRLPWSCPATMEPRGPSLSGRTSPPTRRRSRDCSGFRYLWPGTARRSRCRPRSAATADSDAGHSRPPTHTARPESLCSPRSMRVPGRAGGPSASTRRRRAPKETMCPRTSRTTTAAPAVRPAGALPPDPP
jgi:hypothetical protein